MKRVECELGRVVDGKYLVGEYQFGVACAVAGCLWYCEQVKTVDIVDSDEHTEILRRRSYISREHGVCQKWKL